jgi:hypothetical protein
MATTKISNSGLSGIKYQNISADNNYMETIASTLVGSGGTASITFSNIPQGYKHLQLRAIATTNRAANDQDYFRVRFNSDTGTNYSAHVLEGYGSGIGALATTSTASPYTFIGGGNIAGTNVFGTAVVDILDYSNTNKYKTTRALSGIETNNTESRMWLSSSLWQNTAAISTITIDSVYGATSIKQYSRFSLYGIKG